MKKYYSDLIGELRVSSLKRITSLDPATLGYERFERDGRTVLESGSFTEGETLCETLSLRPTIVLFGAGHIGKALARIADMLDFPLTVVDDRTDFINDPSFDRAEKKIIRFEDLENTEIKADNPYYIITTHGHMYDTLCLEWALKKGARYIGMIGSRKKIGYCFSQLLEKGMKQETLDTVYTPIGLDIHANTPAEIAVSIMAEIISVFRAERNDITAESDFLSSVRDLDGPAVLARIIEKRGSGPREQGCEMAVTENGSIGTIGGGAIEQATIRIAREMLESGKSAHIEDFVLTPEQALGMACGGGAKVLFRKID